VPDVVGGEERARGCPRRRRGGTGGDRSGGGGAQEREKKEAPQSHLSSIGSESRFR
jgi:hypothetical protein